MLEKLLKFILQSTKDGTLVWKLENSMWNSDTRHNYIAEIKDGSKIIADVMLDGHLKFKEGYALIICNPNLPDGRKFVTEDKIRNEIGLEIYKRYIIQTIKPKAKTEEQVFEDIINSIPDKQVSRDQKIDEIIENKKTKKFFF